jgi:hypothetical protein
LTKKSTKRIELNKYSRNTLQKLPHNTLLFQTSFSMHQLKEKPFCFGMSR